MLAHEKIKLVQLPWATRLVSYHAGDTVELGDFHASDDLLMTGDKKLDQLPRRKTPIKNGSKEVQRRDVTIPGTTSRVLRTMPSSAAFMSRAIMPGTFLTSPIFWRRLTPEAPMGPS